MNLSLLTQMTVHFLAIALFIQACEFFMLTKKKSFLEIWSYENLKYDLESGLPLPTFIIQTIFADSLLKWLAIAQIFLSVAVFIHPYPGFFIILFCFHLLNCIRFRGTFNGGSDMMTFVLLTGMLIILCGRTERIQNLGFIYISINTLYSYFKAGLSKIIHKEWRNGWALPSFLKRSLFSDSRQFANWLASKKFLSLLLCWGVIIFELGIPVIFIFPKTIFLYFMAACLFHTVIFVSFGLNRFFWVWLAAWPSLFYVAHLLL